LVELQVRNCCWSPTAEQAMSSGLAG
jgi:hypothetical protein